MEVDEAKPEPMDDGVDYSEYQQDPGSDDEVDQTTEEKLLGDESKMEDDSEEVMKASSEYKSMLDFGIEDKVCLELMKLFKTQKMTYDELDERAKVAIKEFPTKDAIPMLKVISKSSLEHVLNKSAYICGQMKLFRQNKKTYGSGASFEPPGPDEDVLRKLLKESGYPLDITPGQRRYGGPPPGWEGGRPGHGHEIVVGRLPRQYFEDKLIPLFADFGKIYEMRLMIDSHTGFNRNFCFVTYCNKEDATKACRLLNKYEIRKGKTLKANISMSNTRLYVGNIPKGKSQEDIREEFEKITPGVREVIVYCNPEMMEKNLKNKGYCFVEYDDHKNASTAKKKLESGRTQIWGYDVVCEWAEPQEDPDDEAMAKVKVVHVKNLSSELTDVELKAAFEKYGKIEKVQKVRDYGFVHFEKRDEALKAIEELNGKPLGKFEISCGLSKSQVVKRRNRKDFDLPRSQPQERPRGGRNFGRGGGQRRDDFRSGNRFGSGGMVGRQQRMGGMGGMGMGGMGMGGDSGMGMSNMRNRMAMMNQMAMMQGGMGMSGGMGRMGSMGGGNRIRDLMAYDDEMDYQGGYVNTQGNRRRMMGGDFGMGGMGDDYDGFGGMSGGFGGMGQMRSFGQGRDMTSQKRKFGDGMIGGFKRRK